MPKELHFSKDVLIYVPCYNCAKFITRTLKEIPAEFHEMAEVLLVDNYSEDETSDVINRILSVDEFPFPVSAIRTTKNLGYAGSQKLVYSLLRSVPNHFKKVIMLKI